MADKKENSKIIKIKSNIDEANNDRHSANARATADLEPLTPRISTDGL